MGIGDRFATKLSKPRTFVDEIELVRDKYAAKGVMHSTDRSGLSFYNFYFAKNRVARLLAKAIQEGNYHFKPVKGRTITTKTGKREVFPLGCGDRIVQGALFHLLAPHAAAMLPENVYSYLEGRTPEQAVRAFAKYVRQHQSIRNKHLDLYVFRTDIMQYTDRIPVHEGSEIWTKIEKLLRVIDPNDDIPPFVTRLLTEGVRPQLVDKSGNIYKKEIGVPQGIPLCTLAALLFLEDLDRELGSFPGAFYARYGDDILIAHPDPKKLSLAKSMLDERLASLGLKRNQQKDQLTYLTQAGRPSPTFGYEGSCQVEYLGLCIKSNGTVAMSPKTMRRLLRELRARIKATAKLTKRSTCQNQGELLCKALQNCLNPHNPIAPPWLIRVIQHVTCRQQLKHIDYLIALWCAETLCNQRGVKAFRIVSYRQLRAWGLSSICRAKNHFRFEVAR